MKHHEKSVLRQSTTQKRKVVEGEIIWKVYRDQASGQWIGVCDPIGLTTSGDSYRELVENITQSTDSVFKDLLKTGDLDEFLSLRGWKASEVDAPEGEGGIDAPFGIEPCAPHDTEAAVH